MTLMIFCHKKLRFLNFEIKYAKSYTHNCYRHSREPKLPKRAVGKFRKLFERISAIIHRVHKYADKRQVEVFSMQF